MMRRTARYMVLMVTLLMPAFLYAQKYRKKRTLYYKEVELNYLRMAGVGIGYHGMNRLFEIGIGRIMIDKPCNLQRKETFGVVCNFPRKLQIDVAAEFRQEKLAGISDTTRYIIGPKLSIYFTIYGWVRINTEYREIIYRTLGHVIGGVNIISYSDFHSNNWTVRPEAGLLGPQHITITRNGKIQLSPRLVYGYNIFRMGRNSYNLGNHEISLLIFFY